MPSEQEVRTVMQSLDYERPPQVTPIYINCPKCGAKNVAAEITALTETLNGVIRRTITWVKCSACQTDLYSKKPADQLHGQSPEALESIVIHRGSLINRLMAILAILLFFWPLLGAIVCVPALLLNLKTPGWPRTLSRVAFVLMLIVQVSFFVLFSLIDKK